MFIPSTPPKVRPSSVRSGMIRDGDGRADRPLRPRNMPLLWSLMALDRNVAINMALLAELVPWRSVIRSAGIGSVLDHEGRRNQPHYNGSSDPYCTTCAAPLELDGT